MGRRLLKYNSINYAMRKEHVRKAHVSTARKGNNEGSETWGNREVRNGIGSETGKLHAYQVRRSRPR